MPFLWHLSKFIRSLRSVGQFLGRTGLDLKLSSFKQGVICAMRGMERKKKGPHQAKDNGNMRDNNRKDVILAQV